MDPNHQKDIDLTSNYTSQQSDIESVNDSDNAKAKFNGAFELEDMDMFSDVMSSRNASYAASFRFGSIY